MMIVQEIMSKEVRCTQPNATLKEAAGMMRELDVGSLPVCDHDRLTGMLTDRDITMRSVAEGRTPSETAVRDVMSPGIVYVYEDQSIDEVAQLMEQHQIRRLPVLDRDKRLVGIVSVGDLAIHTRPEFSGRALKEVSRPTGAPSGAS